MGFAYDMARGKRGEDLVASILEFGGIECTLNDDVKKNIDYDILCKIGKRKFKVEVKSDYMAEKTGNLAIEYYNTKKDTHSGLYATKAHIWVHCIKDGDNLTVWGTSVKTLKDFVKTETPERIIDSGGDKNASLLLYKDYHILEIFEQLDNLEEKEIKKAIRKLLK